MTRLQAVTLIGALAAAPGCGGGSAGMHEDGTGGIEVTVGMEPTNGVGTIGAGGGAILSPENAGISVPQGAVRADTQFRISLSDIPAPTQLQPLGAVFDFSPTDLVFTPGKTATLQLPLPPAVTAAVVYLRRVDGMGWDLVGGAAWSGSIKAPVSHLGTAFAALPP